MNHNVTAAQAALDDPLRLAEIYRAGLGRSWNSYREGAEQLKRMNLRATYAQLQKAVAVAAFPRPILDLFKYTGLVKQTAEDLIRARNRCGLDRLVERAEAIDPTGKSRTQLIALLSNDQSPGGAFRASYSTEWPLVLDRRYRDGLKLGAWSSIRQAATSLGISASRLASAVQIGELPDEVKELFRPEHLSFAAGWQLVQIRKLRGADALRDAAVAANAVVPALSQQQIMNRLVGISGGTVDVKIKRGPSGKVVLEFHCDANDPGVEARLSMVTVWLQTLR
jgi:uncharacterized protein YjiS (DUF1127 family)